MKLSDIMVTVGLAPTIKVAQGMIYNNNVFLTSGTSEGEDKVVNDDVTWVDVGDELKVIDLFGKEHKKIITKLS